MKIGIIAGEHSGDNLAASLVTELLKIYPHATFEGIAGPKMIEAGVNMLYPMSKLSVMGIFEPIKHIPELLKIRHHLTQHFIQQKFNLVIGVDAPDFNLTLEKNCRNAGIPVVHYVSPSVWAWRRWRVRKIAKAVDLMLTLFPFEEDFYAQYNINAKFVGHPLADHIPLENDKVAARSQLGLSGNRQTIAILPGSRLGELKYLSALFIESALACYQQNLDLQFIAPMANQKCMDYFKAQLFDLAPELPVTVTLGQANAAISAADLVILASGTATLEAALIKRPMVVAYKVSAITAWIALALLRVNYAALPNILLNQEIVPEFMQDNATVAKISKAMLALLNDPARQHQISQTFHALHLALKQNASEKAATAIAGLVGKG